MIKENFVQIPNKMFTNRYRNEPYDSRISGIYKK